MNRSKYGFSELDQVGASIVIANVTKDDIRRIRTAATTYGTRYGRWLKVKVLNNDTVEVVRVSGPSGQRKYRIDTSLESRLSKLESALKMLARHIVEMKEMIRDIDEKT